MPEGDAAESASGDTPTLPEGHPLAGFDPATATASGGTTTTEPATPDTDLAAEVAKWKALAKKHEAQWKAAQPALKEAETLRQQSMSETEKAVAAAKAAGRSEALAEVGGQLVIAQLRSLAAGRIDTRIIDAMIGNLNTAAFLGEDGTVDTEAIAAFVESIAPPPPTGGESKDPRWPDLGQGQQGAEPLNDSGLLLSLKRAVNRA